MSSLVLSWHTIHRMIVAEQRPAFCAIWSFRLALFSGALAIAGIALHRFLSIPTPILLNTLKVAFAGGAIALLMAIIAIVQIWFTGKLGAASAFGGLLTSLALFAWPAAYIPTANSLPPINDVTTDLQAPPPMTALALLRGPGTNPVEYPGETFAEMQAVAYPDLQPFLLKRSASEAFEIVADVVRRLKYQVVAETPPGEDFDQPGYIEAVDRTLIMGFYDDVVIRVMGDSENAQIDVRSASRYGRHDLGRNAARIRTFFQELRTALMSTVPAEANPRNVRNKRQSTKGSPKQQRGGDRERAGRRN